MRKDRLVVTLIAIMAAAAGAYFIWSQNMTPSVQPAATSLSYEMTPAGDRMHVEEGDYYTISATYPGSTPLAATADSAADAHAVAYMESYVVSEIQSFLTNNNFNNLTDEDKSLMGFMDGRKYTLTIAYDKHEGDTTVSYVFKLFSDTGGAHPNTYYQTFTFAKADGRSLILSDLFNPDTPYLSQIASLSENQVKAHLQDVLHVSDASSAIFAEGFAPTEVNYANFYIDSDNLAIIFPPYQVAAYVAGEQEAQLPLSQLKGLQAGFKP